MSATATTTATTTVTSVPDKIAACVDRARQCKADRGFMQYRTFLVRIQWDGGRVGVGTPTTTEVEILPPPQVMGDRVRADLSPAGYDEEGPLILSGISKTFKETELYSPPDVDEADTKFLYRLDDAHSDGIRTRYYVPREPPKLNLDGRKIRNQLPMSWTVTLTEAKDPL